jgi:hypothetical protein
MKTSMLEMSCGCRSVVWDYSIPSFFFGRLNCCHLGVFLKQALDHFVTCGGSSFCPPDMGDWCTMLCGCFCTQVIVTVVWGT